MSIVYVASPYTHENWDIMVHRYNAVNCHIAERMKEQSRFLFFSPIVYFHPLVEEYDLPKDANYWQAINDTTLAVCKMMEVLKLPGYDTSHGIQNLELPFARKLGTPVIYVEPSKKVRELAGHL